jgi:hypothetical protein
LSSAISFDRLLSTVKKIIFVGVEIGLDEAGSRLLGPTAWKYCKKIVSPVIDVLKEEYPSLAFDKPGDTTAQQAAQDAVNFLSSNKNLQDMLWKNFTELKEGQKEILEGVNQMNVKLDLVSKDINEIKQLLNEQTLSAPGALPEYVNVDDIVEETYAFMLAKHAPKPCGVCWLPAQSVGVGIFIQKVLEEGQSYKMYHTKIIGSQYFARPYNKYTNSSGVTCRKYSFISRFRDVDGTVYPEKNFSNALCRVEGFWKE